MNRKDTMTLHEILNRHDPIETEDPGELEQLAIERAVELLFAIRGSFATWQESRKHSDLNLDGDIDEAIKEIRVFASNIDGARDQAKRREEESKQTGS